MLRRSTLNFLVDLLALLAIFVMMATGLVIRFVLPPGTGGGHGEGGLLLWGLGRHDWGDVHFWTSVVLGALLVVHVALHWSWVCAMVYRLLGGAEGIQPAAGRCNACGVGFVVAVALAFGAFTWYAGSAVTRFNAPWQSETRPATEKGSILRHGGEEGYGTGHEQIRGSMSLAEVEAATGVPVDTLKSGLGVPKSISADERLGRLARQHGFSVDEVRHIVAKHTSQQDKR
jgi:hypothetical protein